MKKTMTGLCLALLSMATTAGERLVVSFSDSAAPAGAVSGQGFKAQALETCLPLPSGSSWCVPAPAEMQVKAQSADSVKLSKLTSVVVKVPDELSLYEAQAMLIRTGRYSHVERDFQVKTQSWNAGGVPNDFDQQTQTYFQKNSALHPNANSIFDLWGKIKNPTKNVDVYVMDTGFRLADDLQYADGFNFTVVEFDNERGPGFLELDYNPECDNAHGIGVASVIAANINNNVGMTGMVGDVTIHPLRVMDCGSGFLSDAAAALEWLAGGSDWLRESSPDLPVFDGEPGVVNMSLGGKTTTCPVYLQNAINKAVDKGFVVVVSAGNDTDDASLYSPAGCDNVITVGAMGSHKPEMSHFTNYGPSVDVTAQGVGVLGIHRDNALIGWSGTSFSSPLVAGMIAGVMKDFSFTPEQWETLVINSTIIRWDDSSDCAALGCGSGLLDAAMLYDNANRLANGEMDYAQYSLNAVSPCKQAWAVSYFSRTTSLCDMVDITLGSVVIREGEAVLVGVVAADQPEDAAKVVLGTYESNVLSVMLGDVNGKRVYASKCNSDGQCGSWFPVNTDELTNVPVACQQ